MSNRRRYEYERRYYEKRYEASLEDIEEDMINAVTQRQSLQDWPPRWTRPVVAAGVLWYATLFFT